LTLRQVAYFLAVADEGSFTLAARKLRIAQPSLSQQVQALERDIGAHLLERTSRGLRLTTAGREFLPDAREMVAAAERARLAVRKTEALEGGELEIATVRSLAVGVLPGLIGAFRSEHPGIRIWLREFAHRDTLNAEVLAGLSDLAVGPRPSAWQGPLVALGWEEFVVIVAPGDSAVDGHGAVNLRQLAQREWVLYEPGHGLDDVVMFTCAQAGFTPRAAMRTSQAEAAVRLAASGLGVALVPINIVPEQLASISHRLTQPVVRELTAYTRTHFSPAAEAFAAAAAAAYHPPQPPRAIVFR
jgi:DNA-binding transcriptional LysR family regulator